MKRIQALMQIGLCLGAVAACRTEQTIVTPDPHLERMLSQEKVIAYGESPRSPMV